MSEQELAIALATVLSNARANSRDLSSPPVSVLVPHIGVLDALKVRGLLHPALVATLQEGDGREFTLVYIEEKIEYAFWYEEGLVYYEC